MGVRVVVHEGSRRSLVRRLLPVALAFAAVIAGLALLAPHLRDALGTAPGSPRSGAATHPLYYTGPVESRCALPADREADVTATLRALIPCLDRTWTAALAAAGYEYEPPEEVNLIDTPENAGCGTEDYDWAGIYCPDIHSVNVLVEDDWSFTSMFTLAHEYAHHVQEITGIAAQSGPEVFDEAWSRRLELQADCLAAVTLRGIDPQGLMVLRAHSVEDENAITQRQTHGSARNSAIWIHRGQDSGTIGACNTWAAPADEVS